MVGGGRKEKGQIKIGSDVRIGTGCKIQYCIANKNNENKAKLIIKDHVRITGKLHLDFANSVIIDEHVLIASNVFITDTNHGMNADKENYCDQDLISKDVYIGKGVWIGEQCCILGGSNIGEKSIIGANSVVTNKIPSYCIAAGCPAKPIKKWNHKLKKWEDFNK